MNDYYRDKPHTTTRFTVGTLSLGALVVSYYINLTAHYPVLFVDEWVSLRFYIENGFWGSILCKHNGHPIVLPNFIYRILMLFGGGDALVRGQLTWVLAFINGLLLARVGIDGKLRHSLDVYLLVSAVTTWMIAAHMLNWGMAIHDHLAVLGFIVMGSGVREYARRLEQSNPRAAVYVIVGGVLATFSFGFGPAVWGGAFVGIWMVTQSWRSAMPFLLIGALITAVAFILLPDCRGGAGAVELDLAFDRFPAVLLFAVANIGSAAGIVLAKGEWATFIVSLAFGALVLLGLVTFALKSARGKPLWPGEYALFAVLVACCGAALLIALGRADLDNLTTQSMAHRYLPVSVTVGAVAICWMVVRLRTMSWRNRLTCLLGPAIPISVAGMLLLYNVVAIHGAQWLHARKIANAYRTAAAFPMIGEETARLLQRNKPHAVQIGMPFMRENRYGIFEDDELTWFGRSLAELGLVVMDIDCSGSIRINEESAGLQTAQVIGWAVGQDGNAAQWVLFVKNGVVVGIGKRSRPYWAGSLRRQHSALGVSTYVSRTIGPHVAYFVGLHAEWAGAIRAPEQGNRFYDGAYVLDDRELCQFSGPEDGSS